MTQPNKAKDIETYKSIDIQVYMELLEDKNNPNIITSASYNENMNDEWVKLKDHKQALAEQQKQHEEEIDNILENQEILRHRKDKEIEYLREKIKEMGR